MARFFGRKNHDGKKNRVETTTDELFARYNNIAHKYIRTKHNVMYNVRVLLVNLRQIKVPLAYF